MRSIIDSAAEGIIVVDSKGLIDTFNAAAETLFGYSALEIRGKHMSLLLPDQFIPYTPIAAQTDEIEVIGKHRQGQSVQASLRISKMMISGKRMFTCLVGDIQQRKQAEQNLLVVEQRYRSLVETAHDLVWSVDHKGCWSYLNASSQLIYGLAPEKMLGQAITNFSAAECLDTDMIAFSAVGDSFSGYETIHIDADGNARHLSFNARKHRDTKGNVISISGTARDITEQKAFEDRLTFQAEHDSLTRLFNRYYFQQQLQKAIRQLTHQPASTTSLFYIDLDQFKYVNDTLGHAAGDKLLIAATRLLKKQLRHEDLLARFGGDEFTLLLYNISEQDAKKAAEDIRKTFDKFTFIENSKSFNITCSIGITRINISHSSAEEALSEADIACNLAKSQGRNRCHTYNPAQRDQAGMAEDIGWASLVREMLERDRFQLVYQPILSLADNQVYHYEVLVRMLCDDGKVILPGGFMPAAERFGLIHSVDRWIIRNALSELGRLQQTNNNISFAINLSGKAFEDASLLPLIHNLIDEYNVDAPRVCFEITETAAIANLDSACEFIAALKAIGCQFALDDFGSGFSSFAYLKKLPVDKLKIDGAFVQGLADSRVDQEMVKSMNQVSHALGKETVAEYVENATTLRLLRKLGVDYAQGNYIGKPREIPINLAHSRNPSGIRELNA